MLIDSLLAWLRYFLDGGGKWMTRWHCTSGDWPLLMLSTVACTWLVGEYFIYARQTFRSISLTDCSADCQHRVRLTAVFLLCGSLHFVSTVICWIWTPYYPLAISYLATAYMTRRLNQSKLQLRAEQERQLHRQSHATLQLLRHELEEPVDESSLVGLATKLRTIAGVR